MKRFISIIGVILLIIICDVLAGIFGRYYTTHLTDYSFFCAQVCNVMLNKEADIVIIGASKANHSYITDSFATDNLSAFNAGIDGTDCYAAYMSLVALSSRKVPKIVIFDIADRQLEKKPEKTAKTFAFLYGSSDAFGELLSRELSSIEKIKLRSHLYRYNKFPETIVSMLHDKNKTAGGYVPLEGEYDGDFSENHLFDCNEKEVFYLSEMVDFCKRNEIELILSVSPACVNNVSFNEWLENYCKDSGVILFNNNKLYWDRHDLFHDDMHLNHEGALLFTKVIFDNIRGGVNNYGIE